MNDTVKKEKKIKKQGPIRTGVLVPFIIVISVIVLFNILLLDRTIKSTIEYLGEKANGAEVNVSSVNTSFKDLRISVSRIQFTDKANPEFNKFEIGNIRFQMLLDALLRGKIVITNAEINNVLINTKRKKKGYVIPPPPANSEEGRATAKILGKAKEEFKGNVIGDIAGMLGGESLGDTSKGIEGSLKSKKRFEELKVEIAEKEKKLDETFKKLPDSKDINDLQKRISDIKWNDLGNLSKAQGVLKEADSAQKDIKKTIKAYDDAQKLVSTSLKEVNASYNEAQKLVDEDIKDVSSRMSIPSLDPTSISKMLFGDDLLSKIEDAKKYQTMAKKYMPPKKGKKEAPIKAERGAGRNYRFGTPKTYPMFWMKLAKIDSKNDQGEIQGQITDITTNQRYINKLTKMNLKADFPSQNIRDISGDIILDFMNEPVMKVNMTVGSYPVKDKALSDSKDAKFIIRNSSVRSEFFGTLKEKTAQFNLNNSFSNIEYEVSAKSKDVGEILNDVASKTKVLTLNAKAKGEWDSLKFDINSNLAKMIQDSTKAVIQEKINKVKNKIKADIDKEIAKTKGEVDSKISKLKSEYTKQIDSAKRELDKITSGLSKKKKDAEKDAKKNMGKNLLKGIKL